MPQSLSNRTKNSNPAIRTFLGVICLAMVLGGCSAKTTRPDPAPGPDPAPTIDDVFDEAIHWTRSSAEYQAIFIQTYATAGRRIRELAEGRDPGSWAVSLDADETLLDNSLYQVEIAWQGETYGPESWNPWVHRKEATALPGTVEFTALVKSLGGVVAVVTNRRDHLCQSTAENLTAVGITFDVALCRVDDGEKESRFDAVSNGTTAQWPDAQFSGSSDLAPAEVIMWLGDNIGDFPEQVQDNRHDPLALADFGDRFFVLPNPMYGSWQVNPKE